MPARVIRVRRCSDKCFSRLCANSYITHLCLDCLFAIISGGLLITRGNGPQSDRQVGVVSWGIGCAFLPGVYARVSKGYDWIRETVCDESNDTGGSSLCGTPNPTPRPTRNPTKRPTNIPTKCKSLPGCKQVSKIDDVLHFILQELTVVLLPSPCNCVR